MNPPTGLAFTGSEATVPLAVLSLFLFAMGAWLWSRGNREV